MGPIMVSGLTSTTMASFVGAVHLYAMHDVTGVAGMPLRALGLATGMRTGATLGSYPNLGRLADSESGRLRAACVWAIHASE